MYLGIDLGGTNIAVGLVDDKFNIIHKDSIPTNADREDKAIVKDMAYLCKKVLQDSGTDVKDVKWIGVGSPGTCDVENGILIYTNNIPFRNTPIRKWIQEEIDLPVYINNDANCAALGEAYAGATKDVQNSIMITIGTGLGGGIIINKKIYSGFNGSGGELGHTCIMVDGEECSCGRKGCWEAYGSATALKAQTVRAAMAHPESHLYKMLDGKAENVSGKTAFDAMREGCPVGAAVVDQYIHYFATGIVNMINIFQPDILVIGGGVCKEGDYLLKPLMKYVNEERYSRDIPQTQIKVAELGNDAGIIGAAALGM